MPPEALLLFAFLAIIAAPALGMLAVIALGQLAKTTGYRGEAEDDRGWPNGDASHG